NEVLSFAWSVSLLPWVFCVERESAVQKPAGNWQDHLMTGTSQVMEVDVAIMGGGSGGYAAGRTAVAAGLKTAIVEGGEEVGGLCILRGCMPTKALLYAAEVRHIAQYAGLWGMRPGEVPFDWTAVMARKDGLIREFAEFRAGQLNDGRFEFIRAQ